MSLYYIYYVEIFIISILYILHFYKHTNLYVDKYTDIDVHIQSFFSVVDFNTLTAGVFKKIPNIYVTTHIIVFDFN